MWSQRAASGDSPQGLGFAFRQLCADLACLSCAHKGVFGPIPVSQKHMVWVKMYAPCDYGDDVQAHSDLTLGKQLRTVYG